jgi:hypothetical protein
MVSMPGEIVPRVQSEWRSIVGAVNNYIVLDTIVSPYIQLLSLHELKDWRRRRWRLNQAALELFLRLNAN